MTYPAWGRWALLLGFALGGFFDGILLHQILQWHHLLSLVPGVADLRQQILWDGVFHATMYVLAAVALLGLWRARFRSVGAVATGGALLVGFGTWHGVDAVMSHWLLGIHRIRIDSPNPLAWDLGWLVGFGLLPLALGLLLRRRPQPPTAPPGRSLACLALLAAGAGAWALQPPPGQPLTAVVFAARTNPEEAAAALAEARAAIVFDDPSSGIAIVDMDPGQRWALYRMGAIFVSGTGLPDGCFAWSAG